MRYSDFLYNISSFAAVGFSRRRESWFQPVSPTKEDKQPRLYLAIIGKDVDVSPL